MNLQEKDLKYIWHPCSQMKDYETLPPIVVNRGKGVYLYDVDENKYMDVISSWWCNLFGHSNERINDAVKKQLDSLEHVIFSNFSHKPVIDLCEKLHSLMPEGIEKFFFTDNGSSAIEAAMKMSFQYHNQTGKPEKTLFMALEDAYHGETIGALSVSGVDLYSKMYKPMLIDIIRLKVPRYNNSMTDDEIYELDRKCIEYAENIFSEYGSRTAALLVEPLLQAAAGMQIYSPNFLKALRDLCTEYEVHLIADEIATGFGRTGKFLASNYADITPDIICVSKGLTGGYLPMAVACTTDDIYNAFYSDYNEKKSFMHSHTYCGNPLACAAALEVIDMISEDDFWNELNKKADFFDNLLKEKLLSHPNIKNHRSIGLINAFDLADKNSNDLDPIERTGYKVYKKALELGLILRPLGDTLYFNPPLSITEEELREAVELCEKSINLVL